MKKEKKKDKKKRSGTKVSSQNFIMTKFKDITRNHKVKSYIAD